MTRSFNNFAFTANNPSDKVLKAFTDCVDKIEFINAIIFQREIGEGYWDEEKEDWMYGTVHLQGTLQTTVKKSWKQLNRSLDLETAGIHWETPIKDLKASIHYCGLKSGELTLAGKVKKGIVVEGTQVVKGQFRMRGKRTDLDTIGEEIAKGEFDLEEMKVSNFGMYARNHRAIEKRVAEVASRRRNKGEFQPPILRVFWGPTGTGKSHRVRDECKLEGLVCYTVVAGTSSCWFDGYDSTVYNAIHFEDFYGWYEYARVLVLCDKYSTMLMTKGDSISIDPPKRVYFTSNDQPSEWWPRTFKKEYEKNNTVLSAFARRLSTPGSGIFKLTTQFVTQVGGVILDPPNTGTSAISQNFNVGAEWEEFIS